jgi:hypothetical protein
VQVTANSLLEQHVVLAPAAVTKAVHSPATVEQQLMQSEGQHLNASIDDGQLQQVKPDTAGVLAPPAQAVDGDGDASSCDTGSSSQVKQAATIAAEGVAPDQAEALVPTEAEPPETVAGTGKVAADDGAVGQQEPEHVVVAEHSNASYCSDFEEDAAACQAAGTDAGHRHILAATEAEPAAAAAVAEAQVQQAAAIEGLGHGDVQTEAVQQAGHEPHSHVQAACAELTAEAGVSSGMLASVDKSDSPMKSSEGDATSQSVDEQPVVHAAAPADPAQLCSTAVQHSR